MTGARTIDPRTVPGKPPFKATPAWSGRHGDWQIDVSRVEGDPRVHAVALHLRTGTVHAERLDAATPRAIKAWADALPPTIASGGAT